VFAADIQAAPARRVAHRRHMKDLTRWHRAARVFLAHLLMVHGKDAPEVLRRIANELEFLEAERVAELVG
jgi:hypothetical protein